MASATKFDEVRRRYDSERARRLRAEGNDQYTDLTGDHAHFLDDPWATPGFSREPVSEDVHVVIVGGGFGGLLSAARLKEAGVEDVRIVEKAADFGGTWYWNRYPGAACDTESYIYLPLLEETGYMPRRRYARAPEIAEHAKRIGRHFGLYDRALFQTVIDDVRWDDDKTRWRIGTNRGDVLMAQFIVLAGGPLHRPKLPGIPGIESFKGHSFHTSRWDYDYTGGTSEGVLTGLADKRVGIIGTGATAVQCVPHLGASAKELYVFQRTPSPVGVRGDAETDQQWAATLQPGWQRERMDNFTAVITGAPFEEDMVQDGWTDILGNILLAPRRRNPAPQSMAEVAQIIEEADFQKMDELRDRVSQIVEDPETAEALKPWYKAFCKRPCFHDEYLATYNRPNVHLVDTKGLGVERITETGVVVDGKEYELDCLIYATGFEVGTEYHRRTGFEVHGRGGVTLTEKWHEGITTLHGFYTNGFPNCFFMITNQAGQSANFVHIIDEQSKHIAYVINHAKSHDVQMLEPSVAAEEEWVEKVVQAARGRQGYLMDCTPGYYNNEGQVSDLQLINGPYWKGPMAFLDLLADWRASGDLPGLELDRHEPRSGRQP